MSARPWVAQAACANADPDLFYPPEDDYVPPEVRALCASCPVREECLDWALLHEIFGVWAATSPKRRRQLRRDGRVRLSTPKSGDRRAKASA